MDCATDAMYDRRLGLSGSVGSHLLVGGKGFRCGAVVEFLKW